MTVDGRSETDRLQAGSTDAIVLPMSIGAFDTLTIARQLKAAGFSEDQAEAVTGVFFEARETDLSTLTTKADLLAAKVELRTEIAEAKFEILKGVLSVISFQAIVIVGAIVALTESMH